MCKREGRTVTHPLIFHGWAQDLLLCDVWVHLAGQVAEIVQKTTDFTWFSENVGMGTSAPPEHTPFPHNFLKSERFVLCTFWQEFLSHHSPISLFRYLIPFWDFTAECLELNFLYENHKIYHTDCFETIKMD